MIESEPQLQYISDEKGDVQGVMVSIEMWREILSEREIAHLLNSEAMKRRLLEANKRTARRNASMHRAREAAALALEATQVSA